MTVLSLIVAVARRVREARAKSRAMSRARAEFNSLDAATLRDLGVTRGEFASFWSEAAGELPLTRRRVLSGQHVESQG